MKKFLQSHPSLCLNFHLLLWFYITVLWVTVHASHNLTVEIIQSDQEQYFIRVVSHRQTTESWIFCWFKDSWHTQQWRWIQLLFVFRSLSCTSGHEYNLVKKQGEICTGNSGFFICLQQSCSPSLVYMMFKKSVTLSVTAIRVQLYPWMNNLLSKWNNSFFILLMWNCFLNPGWKQFKWKIIPRINKDVFWEFF